MLQTSKNKLTHYKEKTQSANELCLVKIKR